MFQNASNCRGLFAGTAVVVSSLSVASADILYDGTLGTTPVDQGMFFAAVPSGSYTTTSGGKTRLDTNPLNTVYAGWVGAAPVMDRSAGFRVLLDLKVLNNTSSNSSRAGFSLIVLASDAKGVEIGFAADEIFELDDNPLFVRDGVVSFDTTAAERRYELSMLGNNWSLTADGSPLLSGPVRDYSAYSGPFDVYETPNFLFIGDDTTSARGASEFSYLEVVVPEPATLTMATVGLMCLASRRR
jgi:hypothetical protein